MNKSFKWNLPFLLFLAIVTLIAGMFGGLHRMGFILPQKINYLSANHGPLMVGGFLGTLITLERAVALEHKWGYIAPVMAGIAAIFLWTNLFVYAGMWLLIGSSLVLLIMYGYILTLQPSLHSMVMSIGGLLWLSGNIMWLNYIPFGFIANFWAGFLILTIVGERIELSRMNLQAKRPRAFMLIITIIYTVGLFLTLVDLSIGVYVFSISLLVMALWLFTYDMARITIKTVDLPRYIAVCLLTGYFWLGLSGVFSILYLYFPIHLMYDAMLHSIFLGFVFSMIFAHAPVIFTSIIGIEIGYKHAFYMHYTLLHLSLIIRITGDLLERPDIRLLGGILNVIAILLFLFNTISAIIHTIRTGSAIQAKAMD
jgi:hypothetical protein